MDPTCSFTLLYASSNANFPLYKTWSSSSVTSVFSHNYATGQAEIYMVSVKLSLRKDI
jgi:hypothetical protein